MSRFLTLVLVDVPGLRPEELRRRRASSANSSTVARALRREHRGPYEDRCHCVGLEAERAGRAR